MCISQGITTFVLLSFLTCDDFVAYAAMLLVECPVTTIDASGYKFIH
jgi:hypothetical protein